jgi:iron complex transport system substrate-binding protein
MNGVAAADGPQHVMSLSMCTDELLLELLPPERIASVTYYSRDPDNSYQWPQAAKVPVNWGTVEEVLAEKPDLVLAGTYTTPAARAVLKKLRWPLLEVAPAVNFDQIRAVTRQVAHALRRDAIGESLIAKMDSTLQELADSKPRQIIRVAAWGEGGSIPGRGTLFDAILNAAGGVNIAATLDGGAQHPLVRRLYSGRSVTYPGALYSCGVVESAAAAAALRASLLRAVRNGS